MANALYDKGREFCLEGAIAWLTANIKVVSIDEDDDVPVLTTDDFLDDILAGAREFTSGNFASKTSTDGVADAADITFTAVTGATVEAIVIFLDTGTAANDLLIAYIDTATGLPVTPNGGDITVAWDGGANKIFKL